MKNQTSLKVLMTIGLVFLIGGLIGVIVAIVLENIAVGVISGMVAFVGLIFALVSLSQIGKNKAINIKMNDPSSLYYKTYGGHGNYKYYTAYLDKKKQDATKAVANTVGVLGMVFGFGGVITTGYKGCDVFVSNSEIIMNDRSKNGRMNDNFFNWIPASEIRGIEIKLEKKFANILIDLAKGNLILDIPVENESGYDAVRETFMALKSPATVSTIEEPQINVFAAETE